MSHLLIGLCFGIAAAAILAVMWHMVRKLDDEEGPHNGQSVEKAIPPTHPSATASDPASAKEPR